MKKLVSILTPCYNAAEYIDRFIHCLVNQTYRPIEWVIIDDGSTDNLREIIKANEQKIQKSGIEIRYFYQENRGIGAATNSGLKKVTGQFIMWPDPDDILYETCVEKCVQFLEENKKCDYVLANSEIVDESDLNTVISISNYNPKNNFHDILYLKNVFNIGYMVKKEILDKAIPDLNIYESRHGQNIQLLLPISYIAKCGYLEEVLCCRVKRVNSHSRSFDFANRDIALERTLAVKKIVMNTLEKMPLEVLPYWYYHKVTADILKMKYKLMDGMLEKKTVEGYTRNLFKVMLKLLYEEMKLNIKYLIKRN